MTYRLLVPNKDTYFCSFMSKERYYQINIRAILIQSIIAFLAKTVLFMTFWTNIGPYHMFYIIIYVTLQN